MRKIFALIVLLFLLVSVFSTTFIIADDDNDESVSGGSSNGGDSGSDSDSGSSSGSSDTGGDDKDSDSSDSNSDSDIKSSDSNEEKESNDESDNNDSDNSKSESSKDNDSDDNKETTETIIDDQGREVEVKTEIKDGEIEVRRTYTDQNGNKVVIITKTKNDKDGESETKITKLYTASDGSIVKETTKEETGEDGKIEIKIKIETTYLNGDIIVQEQKTKIENGESKTTNSILFKGGEFTTKLKVTAKIEEDGEEKFSVKLSTGAERQIVSPDEASLAALDVLGTTDGLSIEVVEDINDDGTTNAVFKIKAEPTGNLFGLFFLKVNMTLEALLDADGNLITDSIKKPFYAPFVIGIDNAEICQTESPTREVTNTVLITEIKNLLEEGNNTVGACMLDCGDNILTDEEICDSNSQECLTLSGYSGTETCNADCNGFKECITPDSCGDGIVNGLEACDDGNIIEEDGCNNLCQIVVIPEVLENTSSTNGEVI